MGSLRDLWELVRVAEEHERASARACGEDVGEGELAGLVDEEHVDRPLGSVEVGGRARQRPDRAGDEVEGGVGAGIGVDRRDDAAALERGLRLVLVAGALDALEGEVLRVGLVLDRAEQVVDRLVAERGDADALARRASARPPSARPARSSRSRVAPARTGSSRRARERHRPGRGRAARPEVVARAAPRARGRRRARRRTSGRSASARRG